jgi:hypothetical protein
MKSFRNYLAITILLFGVLSYFIPIRYNTPYPKTIGPQFDNNVRTIFIDSLNAERPEFFLLGDSMPGQAIDELTLSAQLGKKVELVSLPGTASTIWYLIIKNNIVLAEHRPKYLVIFFRDSMMTVPGYRVTGRYFELIDEFATQSDTLLIERAYINQMGFLEKFMEARLPIFGSRWTIRKSIDYYIRYPLGRALLDCSTACTDLAMEVVFKQSNLDMVFLSQALNVADDYLYKRKTLNFEKQIDTSFLPEIIRLCKENNIQLVLVRMPILRFNDPSLQPPGLDEYIENLSAYLTENQIAFLDLDRKNMPVEYFTDTLHLNEQGKMFFTQELAKALKSLIK